MAVFHMPSFSLIVPLPEMPEPVDMSQLTIVSVRGNYEPPVFLPICLFGDAGSVLFQLSRAVVQNPQTGVLETAYYRVSKV